MVPKWVVHDVRIPVDVTVKKTVPVPHTVVKNVMAPRLSHEWV